MERKSLLKTQWHAVTVKRVMGREWNDSCSAEGETGDLRAVHVSPRLQHSMKQTHKELCVIG